MVFEQYEKPFASWLKKERLSGNLLDCLTIILKSGGCSWGRCLMCGYRGVRYPPLPGEELAARMRSQLLWVQERYRGAEYGMVKIYTSGSFFDPVEVPAEVREEAARLFRGRVVIAETRPEHVEESALAAFMDRIDDGTRETPLYVAMGLETASDNVREKSIQKGFTLSDYLQAVHTAHSIGAGVKSYLLLKPPFLTEREACEDVLSSIRVASAWSEMLSLNPCTVQAGTELEALWRRGGYRPAYLWTLAGILARSGTQVLCEPVGAGTARGPHNCGRCDRGIVRAIRKHSLTGEKDPILEVLEEGCSCMEEWRFVMEKERPYCMPLTR